MNNDNKRTAALKWWENTIEDPAERIVWKLSLSIDYCHESNYTRLRDNSIIEIWEKETQQPADNLHKEGEGEENVIWCKGYEACSKQRQPIIDKLKAENEVLREALQNFIGCYDNPAYRRNMNYYQKEAVDIAKKLLQ